MTALAHRARAAFAELVRAANPPQPTGVERLAHPGLGELRLGYGTLEPADADDQRLVVHLPADEATSAALERLV